MKQYIACDMHKRYSVFELTDEAGNAREPVRIEHERESVRAFLKSLPSGAPVAVETMGSWYWMIDDIEEAGLEPRLVHAGKAKVMMGHIHKTDKLDAHGLNELQRTGTLPTVWIPPKALRDLRELTRYRMTLTHIRTTLKNRVHATLAKYAIVIEEVSDLFGKQGRALLQDRVGGLPPETRRCFNSHLDTLDYLEEEIQEMQRRILELVQQTPQMKLLMTLPGVGPILATVIALELGTVERFLSAEKLAGYCGVVPRVIASGGKCRFGRSVRQANQYLKWAFVEAANVITLQQKRWPQMHVVKLYHRIKARKCHAIAAVAVARHLAEAAYWILKKGEAYREPKGCEVSSTHG